MSLQDVEKKVMASAQQEADEIVKQGEADAEAELERRGTALRDDQQRKIQAAKADADAALEREVTTHRAECAMKILAAKNQILDAIFAAAHGRILVSQGFDYGRWLANEVRTAVVHGTGVLHCNQRDRVTVEAVLRETGSDQVTLASDNGAMQGGVLLVGPSFDLDLTLDATLTDLREEHLVSLAERLFADVPPMGDPRSVLGD